MAGVHNTQNSLTSTIPFHHCSPLHPNSKTAPPALMNASFTTVSHALLFPQCSTRTPLTPLPFPQHFYTTIPTLLTYDNTMLPTHFCHQCPHAYLFYLCTLQNTSATTLLQHTSATNVPPPHITLHHCTLTHLCTPNTPPQLYPRTSPLPLLGSSRVWYEQSAGFRSVLCTECRVQECATYRVQE